MDLKGQPLVSTGAFAAAGCLLLAVAACSEPATVEAALLGVCVPASEQVSPAAVLEVEFRLDGEVVAAGSVQTGVTFVDEVPLGDVDIYVDGEYYGAGASYGPSAADEDGRPTGGVYLGGEGCPESAF